MLTRYGVNQEKLVGGAVGRNAILYPRAREGSRVIENQSTRG